MILDINIVVLTSEVALSNTMDDFYKLLNKYRIDGTFCDVALWAKCPTNPENVMGPYSAHKVVLAATCPALASVMTSQVCIDVDH